MDSILLFSLERILGDINLSWNYGWEVVLGTIVGYVPPFVLTPRLVLSLREVYARDLQGRCGSDIDTAFGLTSSGHATIASQIVFAEDGENVVEEPDEEREEGQGEGQDAEQDEGIQVVGRAMSADAGGSV